MPPIYKPESEEPSVFDPLFKVLMDRVRSVTGTPDVSDVAGLSGPIGMAGQSVFRVGNKILKKVGHQWQWLDDSQAGREITKLEKPFEAPIAAKSVDDLKTVVPVAAENEVIARTPAPKLSGKWNLRKTESGAPVANLARSKLNTAMVKDIRERGQAGQHWSEIQKDYPGVAPMTLLDIIKGRSWTGVK